jgi:hypothetical protein
MPEGLVFTSRGRTQADPAVRLRQPLAGVYVDYVEAGIIKRGFEVTG